MTDKFAEFLKIASQLNKMGIVPLLMGSLGLEQVTGQDWQARDIDIMFMVMSAAGKHQMKSAFMIWTRLNQ